MNNYQQSSGTSTSRNHLASEASKLSPWPLTIAKGHCRQKAMSQKLGSWASVEGIKDLSRECGPSGFLDTIFLISMYVLANVITWKEVSNTGCNCSRKAFKKRRPESLASPLCTFSWTISHSSTSRKRISNNSKTLLPFIVLPHDGTTHSHSHLPKSLREADSVTPLIFVARKIHTLKLRDHSWT